MPRGGGGGAGGRLTLRQQAAARLLVAGLGVMAVVRRIGVNKTTIWRWQRQSPFAAEVERLRALAADRLLGAERRTPVHPNAPTCTRAALKGKTNPTPAPAPPPPPPLPPRKSSPFQEVVLRLNDQGITPFTRADEYRKRMREAGYPM